MRFVLKLGNLLTLALFLATATPAAAQVIQDPENVPVGVGSGEQTSGQRDDGETDASPDTSGGGTFRIEDPENVPAESPSRSADADPVGGETSRPLPPGRFRGRWSTQLSADFERRAAQEETLEWRSSFSGRLQHPLSERLRATVEGRLTWWVLAGGEQTGSPFRFDREATRAFVDADLRRLTLDGRAGRWFFSLGHRTTVWGSSDLLRPADVINARDFRRGVSDSPAEERIAQPTIELTHAGERTAVTAVIVPFFVPHRVPVTGTRYAVARGAPPLVDTFGLVGLADTLLSRPDLYELSEPLLLQTELPNAHPANLSGGLRVEQSGRGWDAALSYYFGWDRQPQIEVDERLLATLGGIEAGELPDDLSLEDFLAGIGDLLGGELPLESRYRRRHYLMFDGVAYTGEVGWRTEWVFSPQAVTYVGDAAAVRRPSLQGVFGLSWEGDAERILLTTEGFVMHTWLEDDDPAPLVAETEYGYAAALRARPFAAPSVENRFAERVEVQMVGVHAFQTGVVGLSPSLRFESRGPAHVQLGAQLVVNTSNDEEGIAAALSGTDHVWVRVGGSF